MPIYARIGMHLLFYGPLQVRFLRWGSLRKLLKDESIRGEGLISLPEANGADIDTDAIRRKNL